MGGRVAFLRWNERVGGLGGGAQSTQKLVICRVQRTSVCQPALGDGGGFVKCRERGPVAKVTASKDKLK